MQISIGPGEATTIILAIIGGIYWLVQSQSKTRESILRVELLVVQIPKLDDRVRELELAQASLDPHRRSRMHPLSRAREERHDDEVG